jgi:hypothetical protein
MSPLGFLLIAIIIALPVAWLVWEFRGSRSRRVAPGAVVTVTIARPAQTGAWRASFGFLPTRQPPSFHLKRALHRAGVRGMDMAPTAFSASSDLIEL